MSPSNEPSSNGRWSASPSTSSMPGGRRSRATSQHPGALIEARHAASLAPHELDGDRSPCRWRRRARDLQAPRPRGRRGTGASARPVRTRAVARSGRTSGRAARRARSRAAAARSSRPRGESKLTPVDLNDELQAIAETARAHAADGEELAAVIPAEPAVGVRVYLCAFAAGEERSWLALRADGQPVARSLPPTRRGVDRRSV